jgi:hypothetical protein
VIGLAVALVALSAFLFGRLTAQDRAELLQAELRARDVAEDKTKAWREAFFTEAVREQRLAGFRDGHVAGWRALRDLVHQHVGMHLCDSDCQQRAEHVPPGAPVGPVKAFERPS